MSETSVASPAKPSSPVSEKAGSPLDLPQYEPHNPGHNASEHPQQAPPTVHQNLTPAEFLLQVEQEVEARKRELRWFQKPFSEQITPFIRHAVKEQLKAHHSGELGSTKFAVAAGVSANESSRMQDIVAATPPNTHERHHAENRKKTADMQHAEEVTQAKKRTEPSPQTDQSVLKEAHGKKDVAKAILHGYVRRGTAVTSLAGSALMLVPGGQLAGGLLIAGHRALKIRTDINYAKENALGQVEKAGIRVRAMGSAGIDMSAWQRIKDNLYLVNQMKSDTIKEKGYKAVATVGAILSPLGEEHQIARAGARGMSRLLQADAVLASIDQLEQSSPEILIATTEMIRQSIERGYVAHESRIPELIALQEQLNEQILRRVEDSQEIARIRQEQADAVAHELDERARADAKWAAKHVRNSMLVTGVVSSFGVVRVATEAAAVVHGLAELAAVHDPTIGEAMGHVAHQSSHANLIHLAQQHVNTPLDRATSNHEFDTMPVSHSFTEGWNANATHIGTVTYAHGPVEQTMHDGIDSNGNFFIQGDPNANALVLNLPDKASGLHGPIVVELSAQHNITFNVGNPSDLDSKVTILQNGVRKQLTKGELLQYMIAGKDPKVDYFNTLSRYIYWYKNHHAGSEYYYIENPSQNNIFMTDISTANVTQHNGMIDIHYHATIQGHGAHPDTIVSYDASDDHQPSDPGGSPLQPKPIEPPPVPPATPTPAPFGPVALTPTPGVKTIKSVMPSSSSNPHVDMKGLSENAARVLTSPAAKIAGVGGGLVVSGYLVNRGIRSYRNRTRPILKSPPLTPHNPSMLPVSPLGKALNPEALEVSLLSTPLPPEPADTPDMRQAVADFDDAYDDLEAYILPSSLTIQNIISSIENNIDDFVNPRIDLLAIPGMTDTIRHITQSYTHQDIQTLLAHASAIDRAITANQLLTNLLLSSNRYRDCVTYLAEAVRNNPGSDLENALNTKGLDMLIQVIVANRIVRDWEANAYIPALPPKPSLPPSPVTPPVAPPIVPSIVQPPTVLTNINFQPSPRGVNYQESVALGLTQIDIDGNTVDLALYNPEILCQDGRLEAFSMGPYDIGLASDRGISRRKKEDEDSLSVTEITYTENGKTVKQTLFVLADGMGGHDDGAVASRLVVTKIEEKYAEIKKNPPPTTTEDALRDAVIFANNELYEANRNNPTKFMGSTCTAGIGNKDGSYVIAHVGDSRAYLVSDTDIEQLTQDHSVVDGLVRSGAIPPQAVYTHPQRNMILRSMGEIADVDVDIVVSKKPLEDGEQLLFCCDGLWEMTRDADGSVIQTFARSSTDQKEVARRLICKALLEGGSDNVSVIVARMGNVPVSVPSVLPSPNPTNFPQKKIVLPQPGQINPYDRDIADTKLNIKRGILNPRNVSDTTLQDVLGSFDTRLNDYGVILTGFSVNFGDLVTAIHNQNSLGRKEIVIDLDRLPNGYSAVDYMTDIRATITDPQVKNKLVFIAPTAVSGTGVYPTFQAYVDNVRL